MVQLFLGSFDGFENMKLYSHTYYYSTYKLLLYTTTIVRIIIRYSCSEVRVYDERKVNDGGKIIIAPVYFLTMKGVAMVPRLKSQIRISNQL